MTIPSEALRKCTKCGSEKPHVDFYTRTNGTLHWTCKACFIGRQRERRYMTDREIVLSNDRKWSKEYRARIKDEVYAAYGGYICACCGETEKKFLSIDHINNDGAKFRREALGNRLAGGAHTYRWLKSHGYPKDVQVLCMNCQMGRKFNNGVCPHRERVTTIPQGSTVKRPEAQHSY